MSSEVSDSIFAYLIVVTAFEQNYEVMWFSEVTELVNSDGMISLSGKTDNESKILKIINDFMDSNDPTFLFAFDVFDKMDIDKFATFLNFSKQLGDIDHYVIDKYCIRSNINLTLVKSDVPDFNDFSNNIETTTKH